MTIGNSQPTVIWDSVFLYFSFNHVWFKKNEAIYKNFQIALLKIYCLNCVKIDHSLFISGNKKIRFWIIPFI